MSIYFTVEVQLADELCKVEVVVVMVDVVVTTVSIIHYLE